MSLYDTFDKQGVGVDYDLPFGDQGITLADGDVTCGLVSSWINDYSLGELWRKNIVNGGPVNE